MAKPRLLNLYCCEGGSAAGYARAGFDVVGIDIAPQSRYPFEFIQGDAIAHALEHGSEYDFIDASPPCQFDSDCQRIMGREHPDLIDATRAALESTGRPFVIENVGGAVPKLRDPVELCGTMFRLRTYRHRYFETGGGFVLPQPEHPEHVARQAKMGRRPKPGEFNQYIGHFSGVDDAREDLGVHWMSREGIRECIPPAYTQWIGEQFLAQLKEAA